MIKSKNLFCRFSICPSFYFPFLRLRSRVHLDWLMSHEEDYTTLRQFGVSPAEADAVMQAAERACVNTMEQALDLCDALGAGVGVAVDVYHVWWDPKLEGQIARAGKRVLGYHICD